MLRLRKYVLTQLLPSSSASVFPLHRFISAVSPNPSSFAVKDYLVATCGLTEAQALKASAKLTHLKSPSNPDAVLAFLADLGLSGADVAALVAKDPLFLCAGVDKTLAPVVAGLTGLGLSRSQIARLVLITGVPFRCRSIVSGLQYCLPLFGSSEAFLQALKFNCNLLTHSIESVVEPNVALLRECGLGDRDIAKLCVGMPWLLTANPKCIRQMAARADGLGVSRESPMFRHAMHAVAFHSEEKVAAKVKYLKKVLRWSDDEVGIALSKSPMMLRSSEGMVQRMSEFLISEIGLEPAYIAHRPAMLAYSLERRVRPRYYVVKYLKENGLIDRDRDYYSALTPSEMVFLEKYVCPHKEAAPYLAEDYADACRGQVPDRFRFA